MYDLGEQFKVDYEKAKPNSDCVFQGKNYRITILTERLLRIEYSEEGIFEDRPTELVWNRKFNKPEFKVNEDDYLLEIITSSFKLHYVKGKKFYKGLIILTRFFDII